MKLRANDPEIAHMFHTYNAPALPFVPRSMLAEWKAGRACKRYYGGHFWHTVSDEVNACCNCGARRSGEPQDGT